MQKGKVSRKYKVNFNCEEKSNDLKTFEKSYFLFPNSPSSLMFIEKELPVVAGNGIDTDMNFNAISESILTWENSELKNELKLSRAEIKNLLSKLSVSNSKVDTLTCLSGVVSDQEIDKKKLLI